MRNAAYFNLPRMGNKEAIDVILSIKKTDRKIPRFVDMIPLEELGDKVEKPGECDHPVCASWMQLIADKQDEKGVRWGLMTCGLLGSSEDLWIIKHDGDKWTSPVFTGMTYSQLGKSDWFKKFVRNPALYRDSDNDGWTDAVEKRLGTDPRKADTDGDGIKDSHDMNPLAAPHKLTETEQVLQAAFESMYSLWQQRASSPCLLSLPKGAKPFEVLGWGWITIPTTEEANPPLMQVSGKGLGMISLSSPYYDFTGKENQSAKRNGSVLWNANHTEAKVGFSSVFHPLMGCGYDLHLKKFGSNWVVIEMVGTWIS